MILALFLEQSNAFHYIGYVVDAALLDAELVRSIV
jgi:hypothetical protein